MTSTATPKAETQPPASTWQLVHAEPGALVYAVPGVAPTHPLARRTAGRPTRLGARRHTAQARIG